MYVDDFRMFFKMVEAALIKSHCMCFKHKENWSSGFQTTLFTFIAHVLQLELFKVIISCIVQHAAPPAFYSTELQGMKLVPSHETSIKF